MKKKTKDELPEVLDKKQIAKVFGVCTKTVERMFDDGLESFKIRNKRYTTKTYLFDYINKSKTA